MQMQMLQRITRLQADALDFAPAILRALVDRLNGLKGQRNPHWSLLLTALVLPIPSKFSHIGETCITVAPHEKQAARSSVARHFGPPPTCHLPNTSRVSAFTPNGFERSGIGADFLTAFCCPPVQIPVSWSVAMYGPAQS